MKEKGILYWALVGIAVITILSGTVQGFAPGFVLGIIGGESTPTTHHFFAIVGMFMFLFGGMALHALLDSRDHRLALQWAAAQKFGAFLAVSIGVIQEIFGPLAFAVALFDFLSGALLFYYAYGLHANRFGEA